MEAVKNHSQNVAPEFSEKGMMASRIPCQRASAGAARYEVWRLANRARQCLVCLWCIWYGAVRSFRGHIQIQSARDFPGVNIGPASRLLPSGGYGPDERTIARSEYMQRLKAIHPWVGIVDLRIFLMGFDAGEQWAFRMGSEAGKLVEDT